MSEPCTEPTSANEPPPYSRADFDRLRNAAEKQQSRDGLTLAAFSVAGGFGQLGLLRWADANLAPGTVKAVAGSIFLAYAALIVILLVRMNHRFAAALPRCPHCSQALGGMSQRVAAATGKCDRCGGAVVA